MQDELWKQIIEALFPDFVDLFLPDLAQQVDLNQPYTFLDQELNALSLGNEQGNRRVDRLVKVFLKDGNEQWVLIHAEVQGYHEIDFAERMLIYFYRIYDKYRQKIAAIAIFADSRNGWKPDKYEYEFANTRLTYQYPVYKILEQSEADLKASENPFALVVLAAQYALRGKRKDESTQLRFKLELIDLLFAKSYDNNKIKAIFYFVDALIKMKSQASQIQFTQEVRNMATTNKKVRILGDYAEVVLREGKLEGIHEGKREAHLESAKNMKADGMDADLIAKYTGLSLEQIAEL